MKKVITYKGQKDYQSIPNIPDPFSKELENWIDRNIPSDLRQVAISSPWYNGELPRQLLQSIYCNIRDVEDAFRKPEVHQLVDWFVSSIPEVVWDSIKAYWAEYRKLREIHRNEAENFIPYNIVTDGIAALSGKKAAIEYLNRLEPQVGNGII